MNIKTVYSSKPETHLAVEEIKTQLEGFNSKAILFFCSSRFIAEDIADKMHTTFSNVDTFGCTTAGEIVSGKMLNDSLVAMAFDEVALKDLKIEVVEKLSEKTDVLTAFCSFEKYFGKRLIEMCPQEYVGIILIDGLSGAEEKLMDQIGDKTNITFIGGSAGDDLKFKKTYVFANGKAYTDAVILSLLKPGVNFDFLKTQSFKTLDKKLVATDVDEKTREIKSFNNKKAVDAYAEALDICVDNLQENFFSHPVGLVSNNEPFVRSPQSISENGSIKFYCNVKQGTELSLLESKNIIEDTKRDFENKKNEFGNISGVINFNCILRTLELQNKNQTKEYGELFSSVPTIGFSTYGEEFIGHINQTATMLIFGN